MSFMTMIIIRPNILTADTVTQVPPSAYSVDAKAAVDNPSAKDKYNIAP